MNISVNWHWCNAVHQHIAHKVALKLFCVGIFICFYLFVKFCWWHCTQMNQMEQDARNFEEQVWSWQFMKMLKFENLSEWGFLPLSCAGRDSPGLKCTLGGEGVVWAEGGNEGGGGANVEGGGLTSHYVRLVRRRRRRRRRCKSGKIFIVRLSRPKI